MDWNDKSLSIDMGPDPEEWQLLNLINEYPCTRQLSETFLGFKDKLFFQPLKIQGCNLSILNLLKKKQSPI